MNIATSTADTFENDLQQDVMVLTENLIQKVSKKINYSFFNDPQLLNNLYAHLSMRLSRKQNSSMNTIRSRRHQGKVS